MIGAIGFTFPAVLAALALLPLIWWLLRLIPPRPQTELFPPLRILARLVKKEETPAKSPWWLTALRLGLTALVILALARPILNPQSELASGDGPLLILIDNDWSAAPDWDDRIRTAGALVAQAGNQGRPVALAPTVAGPAAPVQLIDAGAAADMLGAIEPVAGRAERDAALARLLAAAETADAPPVLVLIDTGLAEPDGEALNARLADAGLGGLLRFSAADRALTAITAADNRTDGFTLGLVRTPTAADTASVALYDSRERLLGRSETTFEAGAAETTITFDIPFELRNDIATARIDGAPHAGAAFLLDENNRRRRVALLTGLAGDEAQPLLSPLFYISRALAPFADLIEPRTGDLSIDIPEMIDQGPAMIVMADIGVLPSAAADRIDEWLAAGGTLVRFAGPRLAASANDDPHLPVTLRAGERALGGALSWSEPQAVAAFGAESPFAGLDAPRDVTVTRQILAQPDADLADRTWASLADGTPLVTGDRRGEGAIVLFHVTAEATWSNLPISGTFVDMLRRITDFARNTEPGSVAAPTAAEGDATLPPLRILRADGALAVPPAHVRPLDTRSEARPGFENPAGLYGSPEGFVARNVLTRDETLAPFAPAAPGLDIAEQSLVAEDETDLSGWLFLAAFLLLIADTLAVLWINGRLSFATAPRRGAPAGAAIVLIAGGLVLGLAASPAHADDTRPGDDLILDALETTRIAYVLTGDRTVDETTRAGIDGLTRFLASRTAFEPGTPVGLDIEADELAFYPLIYFPVSAGGDMPSETAVARLDAYMQNGGTILFDTRDQLTGSFIDGATPETERLRDILDGLNVPPLEPVPPDHVLTKAFYILDNFPGRYSGSPLWVEASAIEDGRADRPVRTGDGVTPIMITGNDLAAAWALDQDGRPLHAIATGDPLQRIYAFRSGVNIMMYMLTGNYKADQVHIPALLERLGQ
ncbi:MAG: DUF4159 domain-containing protein [Roseitalea sp.]|jgi:hypothetical protein|nr:DUF4159 domain-containing protein [Roseitalea sp.]MBO6723460.1 DUF4159 domain-containing protein [Roseitalea sp.]MBO6742476.1 DUF4159 domain-containing protein [Roseitalea sp.]